jgi:hypothetical protein
MVMNVLIISDNSIQSANSTVETALIGYRKPLADIFVLKTSIMKLRLFALKSAIRSTPNVKNSNTRDEETLSKDLLKSHPGNQVEIASGLVWSIKKSRPTRKPPALVFL